MRGHNGITPDTKGLPSPVPGAGGSNTDTTFARNPYTLCFRDAASEQQFLEYYAALTAPQMRFAFLMGVVLYGMFGIWDYLVVPDFLHITWTVRYAVILPLGLAVVGLTHMQFMQRHLQKLTISAVLIGAAGIVFIAAKTPMPPDFAYPSLMLLMAFALTLARLRFTRGVLVALAFLASYQLLTLFMVDYEVVTLISSNTFLISSAILGLCTSYVIESYTRNDYVQERAIQRANAELVTSNEQLENLNNEKNEFLGIAAHDLKNPLASVVLAVSSVSRYLDKMKPQEVRERLQQVEQSAERMQRIIQSLLNTNAIESGTIEFNIEPTSVSELLQKVAADYQSAAGEKSIELHLERPEQDVYVKLDRVVADQILDNFVSNAIKFSQPGTQITLRVRALGRSVRLEVEDQGPGILPQEHPRLFKKFQRLSARPTAGEDSTGLGLANTYKLAQLIGARVACKSEAGRGSLFYIEFDSSD